MKIIVVINYNPFSVSSASANRWRTMIEGLAKHGAEIHMVILGGYQGLQEYKDLGRSGSKNGISYNYTIYAQNHNIWWSRLTKYVLSPHIAPFFNKRSLNRLIKKTNPDIVFLHPSLDVLELFISSFKEKRSFLTMTELNEFSDVSINYAHNRFQRSQAVKKDKLLKNEVLPSIDLCLVMTKTLLNHYQNFTLNYKTRFLHFPMTVDFSRFNVKSTPNIEKNESYLAFCGTSSFRKDGVDIMIKAFAKVVEQFPNNKLKIAAFWGHDGPKMMELIKIHQLNDKVEYVGTVNRDKIPDFLMNAKVLLLPRPDSHQAQGGFPTKLGEYLATGNPVCATRVGEIPDYLIEGESAFLAEPGSVESFADAIMRALSNFEKAKQIGQKGRIIAEDNFNMEAQAKTLYCFLEECLEKKK